MQYPSVLFANCNIHLHYFLHKVNMLTPSCHKWPAHTVIWIWFVFNDAWVHFLSEIDKIWCETSQVQHLSLLKHWFSPIAGVSHSSILCIKKSPPKSPFWEKNKKHGSDLYLLMHRRINCRRLTKLGIRLAKYNMYLCYFLHKVKILTPSYHKWPARPVIWIKFIFTKAWAHFLKNPLFRKEPTFRKNKKPGFGSYLLTHGPISCKKLTKCGMRLDKCNIYLC